MRYQGPFGVHPGEAMGEFVSGSGGLDGPSAAMFGPDGKLYVASSGTDSVLRYQGPFDANPGQFIDAVVPPKSGGLFKPEGLAFGPDGRLYVSSGPSGGVLGYRQDPDPVTKAFTFNGTLAYVVQPGPLLFSSVPEASASLGDFNGDTCVGRADLTQLVNAIRSKTTDMKYNLNGDSVVDTADARKLTLLFKHPDGSCP